VSLTLNARPSWTTVAYRWQQCTVTGRTPGDVNKQAKPTGGHFYKRVLLGKIRWNVLVQWSLAVNQLIDSRLNYLTWLDLTQYTELTALFSLSMDELNDDETNISYKNSSKDDNENSLFSEFLLTSLLKFLSSIAAYVTCNTLYFWCASPEHWWGIFFHWYGRCPTRYTVFKVPWK